MLSKNSSYQSNLRLVSQDHTSNKISIIRETATVLNQEQSDRHSSESVNIQDMSESLYYFGTIIYYGLGVFGACVIPDVAVIFEFVATICVNTLTFILPSVFYLKARKQYPDSQSSRVLVVCSYIQFSMGIIAFVAGMFDNIYGIIKNGA